jgi:hypothetical protein
MESGAGPLKAMEGVTGTHAPTGDSAISSRHVGRTATDLLSVGVPAKYSFENGGMIDEMHELCLGSWAERGCMLLSLHSYLRPMCRGICCHVP